MSFTISTHGFINILLTMAVITFLGRVVLILLLGGKRSKVKNEVLLSKLSDLWTKEKSGEIHISKLAPIWCDNKEPCEQRHDYKFRHKQIETFFQKHIDQPPWFKNAFLQKEVCAEILLLLDKEGDCPSVVNAAKDVEAAWDSNTYTLLGKTTLLDHTLNVATETIKLLLKADAKHVIPDSVIAALGHDLGKLPSIKGYLYSLGEHPLTAGRVLADIASFKQLSKKKEISRAIKLHHKRPEGLLGKTLKKADQLARQKELECAVEQLASKETLTNTTTVPAATNSAHSPWQAQSDIYGEERVSRNKKNIPTLMDISKWFDAQDFLQNLRPYINRVTGRRFMAFSMSDGHIYFQAKAIEEVTRKQAEQNGAMDIATMAADDTTMRQVLFTVVHHLRVEHDVIARGLIKEHYFGGYFIITLESGKTLKGYYTPFHAEAFVDIDPTISTLAEMENSKPGLLKKFKSVKPHITSGEN